MSRENGFLQLRRRVFRHVRDGCLNPLQALCFIYMLSQADTRSGVWKGGAGALAGELSIPDRTARRVLEALDAGYIKRFAVPGRNGCYPILLHKFLITDGEHRGEQLNALDSESPAYLRYFPRELNGEHEVEHVTTQKKLETIEKKIKKNPAAKPTPPADSRRQPFIEFATKSFESRFGQKPSWQGKDWKQLKNLLAATSAPQEEIQARWQHFLASTEAFTAKQGGSLAYFCTNFDAFINGPLVAPAKGTGHGKPTGDDLTRANLKAAGFAVN